MLAFVEGGPRKRRAAVTTATFSPDHRQRRARRIRCAVAAVARFGMPLGELEDLLL
jgi:hypothetical protein